MKIFTNLLKKTEPKPEPEDKAPWLKLHPDYIFSDKFWFVRHIESSHFGTFIAFLLFFIFNTVDEPNIATVVLYPFLFATFYLVHYGLKASVRKYIVLYFIGILMQVQILCLMSQHVSSFKKGHSILEDISCIISQISSHAFYLVLGFTFMVQLCNVLIFLIRRKRTERSEKTTWMDEILQALFVLNFLFLLYGFGLSLVTPPYQFATVILYPQLFIQYYMVKSRYESERMGPLKYFGYGVAMQIHTLILMFLYRSTWDLDMLQRRIVSTTFLHSEMVYYMCCYTLFAFVFNTTSLFLLRERRETIIYANHAHRNNLALLGYLQTATFYSTLTFIAFPESRFALVLLAPQYLAQLLLSLRKFHTSYKQFLGLFGFSIALQYQAWLFYDQFVIFKNKMEENGLFSMFNVESISVVVIIVLVTLFFQYANYVIYYKLKRTKNYVDQLDNNGKIKLYCIVLLTLMVVILVCSLIIPPFRFASIILVPQIFVQCCLIRYGIFANMSRIRKALNYGLASQLVVIGLMFILSLSFEDDTGKLSPTIFNSYSDFSQGMLLIVIVFTMFVQISIGVLFYIRSRVDEEIAMKRTKVVYDAIDNGTLQSFLNKLDEELKMQQKNCIP